MSRILEPVSKIKVHLGIEPNGKIQKFFTNECYKRMDKYVPVDTGDLRSIVTIGANYIDYNVPYAHAQYVGYTTGPVNPKNYTKAGTGPYWDQRMMSAEMTRLIEAVQKELER